VVPPDPLQVRDLDENQPDDGEEEELAAHVQTVSGPRCKRNRPDGLDASGGLGCVLALPGAEKIHPNGKEVAMYVGLGTVLMIILIIILLIWIF
jgi:hypothetical protein